MVKCEELRNSNQTVGTICNFCGSDDLAISLLNDFNVCCDCRENLEDLIQQIVPFDVREAVKSEPVTYEYTPSDGEIMYLKPKNELYQIEIQQSHEGSMIYLDPILDGSRKVPITEMKESIGQAIGDQEFYQVTVDANADTYMRHLIALTFASRKDTITSGAGETTSSEISFEFGKKSSTKTSTD